MFINPKAQQDKKNRIKKKTFSGKGSPKLIETHHNPNQNPNRHLKK